MFDAIRDLCDGALGWIDWRAVSGLGAAFALVWAVNLTWQQNADLRRREAALVKAILVTISLATESIRPIDDLHRWSWAYFTELLTPEEYRRRYAAVLAQSDPAFTADVVETAMTRLDAIRITEIPSSSILTDLLSVRIRLGTIHEELLGMAKGNYDPRRMHSDFSMMKMISDSMISRSRRLGVRPEPGDSEVLKQILSPRRPFIRKAEAGALLLATWLARQVQATPAH